MKYVLIGALLLGGALPMSAQTARDSAHVTTTRAAVDTIRRTYPGTLRKSPTLRRMVDRIAASESTLIYVAQTPTPTPTPPPVPAAPVASFEVSCALLLCSFNANASTGPQLTFAWDCGVFPNCAAVTSTFSFQYPHEGPRTATLTVRDSLGRTASVAKTFTVPGLPPDTTTPAPPDTAPTPPAPPQIDTTPTIAALPRVYLTDAYPVPLRVIRVPASGSLQAALDTAKAGDEIQLTQGTVYAGNLTWTRCLAGWVTITTQGIALAEGQRATPTVAQQFAKIVSPNVAPVLVAKNGGCKLWLSRLEITATAQSATVNYNYGLVRLGEDETSNAALPHDIVIERAYIHGTPTTSTQNAVVFNAARLTLKDSWVSEIHWPGTETHCVVGYDGTGPFRLTNNYLSCASINVLLGGATPQIAGNYSGDVEIRSNHITKNTAWRGAGFAVKNLVEIKNARRVLVEGNVLENSWSDAQEGMAINAQSNGEYNPLTADLTFRWNAIRSINQCFVLLAHDALGFGQAMARVAVEQNLCTQIGGDQTNRFALLLGDLQGVRIGHNTVVRTTAVGGPPIYLDRVGGGQASRLDLVDNAIGPGLGFPCVFGEGQSGSARLSSYAAAWSFVGNVCWESYLEASVFPAGNYFPLAQAAVGFAADWSLSAGSAFKGTATDGTDPGVNVGELTRRTAGVVVAP